PQSGWQATDVVLRFDDSRTEPACRFDDIGIEGALRQELDGTPASADSRCLGLEYLYELTADDLALGLRVCDSRQSREEALLGVDDPQVDTQRPQRALHLDGLTEPQEPVIDEDGDQLLAKGPVEQQTQCRRVDPARYRQQHTLVAHCFPHLGDGIRDDVV